MADFKYYRPDNFPPIVKNLIIINVLVFLAQTMFDRQYNLTGILALYPAIPEQLRQYLVEFRHPEYLQGERFYPYQIATHMFTHGSFMHILFNMFGLWMFGKILENVWGAKRFLFFYLACGVGAAAVHLTVQYFESLQLLHAIEANDPDWQSHLGAASPAVGASGAIMGIFAAFAFLFPNTELFIMFIPFPVKAKWAVLGLAAFDLLGGISSYGTGIAHFAHLGGALTGFILVLIWNKTGRQRFY